MTAFGLGDLAFVGAASRPPYDADAMTYITAVEAADGQTLEVGLRDAIDAFVRGCKADGIWNAIKASCILAGARTLAGALVPLVGAAPTNNNFVSGDYNRKTGLAGNGSSKYLNANRNDSQDPQNNAHSAVYISSADTRFSTLTGMIYLGSSNLGASSRRAIGPYYNNMYFSNRSGAASSGAGGLTGFLGTSRNSSSGYSIRRGQANDSRPATSVAPGSQATMIFADTEGGSVVSYTNARLAFYSIGEALDLALLDARVTDLINALGSAF